ncbi:hypothetical protein P4E94_15080 [Pontiellaceae bacterium B12219]|nr:hypothetical protein [Pontiellaceae bacterium B12219]
MNLGIVFGVFFVFTGCTTLNDATLRELDRTADKALAKMVLAFPGLQSELGLSQGYLVLQRSGSWVPTVGKKGYGILTGKSSGAHSYFRIEQVELNGAWGVGDYTGLMVLPQTVELDQVIAEGLTLENSGTLYIYAEDEHPAAYSIKIISMKPLER